MVKQELELRNSGLHTHVHTQRNSDTHTETEIKR